MYLSCRRKPEYSEETGMHREKIRLLAVKQQLLPYLSVLCHVACSLICVELWVRKILFCMQFSCYWKINVYFTKVIYRTQSGLFWHHRGSWWLFSTLYVLLRLLSSKHVSVFFFLSLWSNCPVFLCSEMSKKSIFKNRLIVFFFFLSLLILCLWTENHKHISFLVLSMSRKSSPYWLMPHLTLLAFYWFEPPTLPSPDSCLFSPTLIRDLIEGNHSDKKPPILLCVCVGVCVWVGGDPLLLTHPTRPPPLLSHSLHHH